MSADATLSAIRLVSLIDVETRILDAASRTELAFITVNETHTLSPYRLAVLWSAGRGVEAVSGLAQAEPNAPFVQWLERVFPILAATFAEPSAVTAADLPAELAGQWSDWLPSQGLLLPWPGAVLLLAREDSWSEPERQLTARLVRAVAVAWRNFDRPSPWARLRRRGWSGQRSLVAAATAAIIAGAVPVTDSVLAPAEMVPAQPAVVRAPLEGVVDKIEVSPNQHVTEGQPLFSLDPTTLSGKLEVTRRELATAQAEYRQAAQAQLFDPKAKSQVAILLGRNEEKQAEVDWLQGQLERIRVRSPRDGVVVLDDPSDWPGRPVAVGERVMLVADETDTEVEAWLPVSDAGQATPGARLTLFLNTDPLSPVRAFVRTVAYETTTRPDGTLAYRIRAGLSDGGQKPRLGLKGTARIDGDRVALAWWLFRRPVTAVRQMLGI